MCSIGIQCSKYFVLVRNLVPRAFSLAREKALWTRLVGTYSIKVEVCLDNWQEISSVLSSVLVYFADILDILRCVLRPESL